jgi:hypothetical protein
MWWIFILPFYKINFKPTQTIHSDRLDKNPLTISIYSFYLIWIKELKYFVSKTKPTTLFLSVNDIKHMYVYSHTFLSLSADHHVDGIAWNQNF